MYMYIQGTGSSSGSGSGSGRQNKVKISNWQDEPEEKNKGPDQGESKIMDPTRLCFSSAPVRADKKVKWANQPHIDV